jgi:hypothetical protein
MPARPSAKTTTAITTAAGPSIMATAAPDAMSPTRASVVALSRRSRRIRSPTVEATMATAALQTARATEYAASRVAPPSAYPYTSTATVELVQPTIARPQAASIRRTSGSRAKSRSPGIHPPSPQLPQR